MLVSLLGGYVEDFTADDIMIDQWNGRVAKENVKLKSTALEGLTTSLFGAPCHIVQGYIKKVSIEVPWYEILSKPVEIKLEEIHVILKASESYDKEFVKRQLLNAKKKRVAEILTELAQKAANAETENREARISYLQRVSKIIKENLRLNIHNIHLRFEDQQVSRPGQSFNFGFIAESLIYSMTNNRFTRAFLSIDDKIQEQKSFSLLMVTKFTMYWNSNAQENWTKNASFVAASAKETIEFSKSHIEYLMRKDFNSKDQDINASGSGSSVFLIQPCSWSIKFRKNLNPKGWPDIPLSTTFWESSDIKLTIDEEVYQDFQYLTKFFAWHAQSVKKTSFLKYRPPYNCPVSGNARAYWRYAIKATIYLNQKDKAKQSKEILIKRQNEMIQLLELYKVTKVNQYFKESQVKERLLEGKYIGTMASEDAVKQRVMKLECKLTPEQIVASTRQAEKEAQAYIDDYKHKHSWVAWVPKFSTAWFGYGQTEEVKEEGLDQQMQKQLDLLSEKQKQIDLNAEQGEKSDTIQSCFMFQVPAMVLQIVNKQGFVYDAKCFMSIAVGDLFYQSVVRKNSFSEKFVSIKNFDIVDKLVQTPQFQKMVHKKPLSQQSTQKKPLSKMAIESYLQNRGEATLAEIEEESNPNINNGLPLCRNFADVARSSTDCDELLLLFQLTQSQTNDTERYRIDLLVNPLCLFYNRALIARTQTFMHQAMIQNVQNAQAEADFDQRMQALQQRTTTKVKQILRKSVFEVACTVKAVELLIPDDTNFDEARFLMLQTGNIILRSKQPQNFMHKFDIYFENRIDRDSKQLLQTAADTAKRDEFTLTTFDIQVLYISSLAQLESVLFNEIPKEDIDKLYSLLRRTDSVIHITKLELPSSDRLVLIDAHISNVDVCTTTREIKELKSFADKLKAYHSQLLQLVEREKISLREEQADLQKSKIKTPREGSVAKYQESSLMQSETSLTKSQVYQLPSELQSVSSIDEFYDTNDFFDTEIINDMKRTPRADISPIQQKPQTTSQDYQKNIIILVGQIQKLKIQVQEATYTEQLKSQSKGLPFLSMEIHRSTLSLLKSERQYACFTLKEFSLNNIEKQSNPHVIARSADSAEMVVLQQGRKESMDEPRLFDPEDEDNMAQVDCQFDQVEDDYYVKVFVDLQPDKVKTDSQFGLTEIEISDVTIRKVIETLASDWPASQQQSAIKESPSQAINSKSIEAELKWKGLVSRIRVKKDTTTFKILGVGGSLARSPDGFSVNGYLDDFQILHQGDELVYKYTNFQPRVDDDHQLLDSHILRLQVVIQRDSAVQVSTELQNILTILDIPQVFLIVQNVTALSKIIRPCLNHSSQTQKPKSAVKPDLSLELAVTGCFIQVPTMSEVRNQLFIEFDNLKLSLKQSKLTFNFKHFYSFVAKQIDQETKYPIVSVQEISLQKSDQQTILDVGSLQLTCNENYILFMGQLTDYHFEDLLSLTKFVQEHFPPQAEAQSPKLAPEPTYIADETLVKLAQTSMLVKSIISMLEVQNVPITVSNYTKVDLRLFEIQWVIGMTLDQYEENYLTLNSKNFTRIILDQLDKQKQESDIETKIHPTLYHQKSTELPPQFTQSKGKSMQSGDTYDKLIFRTEKISLETAKANAEFSASSVASVSLETVSSQVIQSLMLLSGSHKSPLPALQIQKTQTRLQVWVNLVDFRVCKQTAQIISTVVKNAYSCKNALKRGKKRKLLKNFLSSQVRKPEVEQQLATSLEYQVKVKKFRIVCYEGHPPKSTVKTPPKQSPGVNFIDTMTQKAVEKLTDFSNQFKSRSVFVVESAFTVTNSAPDEEEDGCRQPDSNFKCQLQNLQMYLNSNHVSVADLLSGGQRLMLLYPVEINLENQFYSQKNLNITDVLVSVIELEFSFKQIFFLLLLKEKLAEAAKPISQVLDHMQSNTKEPQPVKTDEAKQSTMLTLSTGSIYAALIKETGDQNALHSYSGSALPLLSVEIRHLFMKQKKQPSGLQQTEITFPFELYYFNQKLSFFEPAIEKVLIKCQIEGSEKQSTQKLLIEDVLNLNFSVALYENLFLLMDYLKEEKQEYARQIESQTTENVLGQALASQQPEGKETSKSEGLFFSPSSYFIKNKTGELLMFMASKKPAFTELQPNESLPLDFQKTQFDEQAQMAADLDRSLSSNQELFEGVDIQPPSEEPGTQMTSDSGSEEDDSSESDEGPLSIVNLAAVRTGKDPKKPRSPYRRGQFKFKKSEPNRVQVQVTIQRGKQLERTIQFEINFDQLTCQRFYLDEQRLLYVICQTQIKDGQKFLIVRSPMQITNNLQIPIEVQLIQPATTQGAVVDDLHEKSLKLLRMKQHDFNMVVKPGSSQIIPLKACNFDKVQIRPLSVQSYSKQDQTPQFEWSKRTSIKLLQDEAMIFEQQPIVCQSRIQRNGRHIDNNNHVYFVLNANTYSIRSFIDFNTQQTEFFSLRYLSVTAPYTVQNLIPVPITMIFKNIVRESAPPDSQLYDLSLKHNSSLQVLYLNPLGNFDFSVAIPGFQQSNFMPFKLETDDDFKLSSCLLQKNYVEAGFTDNPQSQDTSLEEKAQWRFVKQKRLLLQLCSQFQSQFNICMSISFVQGFYHVSFYAKYWFLNNTQMPLLAQVAKETFSFPTLELPFQSKDFDLDTVKHFSQQDGAQAKKDELEQKSEGGRPRLPSGETLQTEQTPSPFEESKSVEPLKQVVRSGMISQMFAHQNLMMVRLKPWEAYKGQQATVNSGLLAALSQEDIDRVSSIYFTQELIDQDAVDDNESAVFQKPPSQQEPTNQTVIEPESPRITSARRSNLKEKQTEHQRSQVQFDVHPSNSKSGVFNKAEKLTKMSRTSIQVTNFTQQIHEQKAIPLQHTQLTQFDLFSAPLKDKDQLKRVILFSDVPTEELSAEASTQQKLKLKICNSEWCQLPFDMAKLQSDPIRIYDGHQQETSMQPRSLFEIVSVVSYLPQPFSFSKLICFQPRYLMVNKTFMLVTVVQAQCEDLGSFKIFPQETSVFHWTDAQKPLEICVRVDDHEFSGNIKLDNIGEVNLRLKNSRQGENLILNVSISEETNSFYIVFSDVSFQPPFRIENLTKSRFKVQQTQGRIDDFDLLNAFQMISFAWSYPLQKRMLKLSLCHLQSEELLGEFNIDSVSKNECMLLKERSGKKNFILEITNEKTIKVVRIIYPHMVSGDLEKQEPTSNLKVTKQKLLINRLGLSVVNSQARELCYISVGGLKVNNETTPKHQKVSFKAGDIQIDNQLSRSVDAIIFRRKTHQRAVNFLHLKFLFIKNQAIENLLYFKHFSFKVEPFELNIDGNFCDETYKYIIDVLHLATKHAFKTKQGEIVGTQQQMTLDGEFDPTALRSNYNQGTSTETTDQMKSALSELTKKGQPYLATGRDIKKIYFENFEIKEIRFSFTFSSSPLMFREFTMNPTLKFFIVLLSNLKNVKLVLSKFQMQNQHLLLSIFFAQMRRFYWHEVANHAQLLKIVSSMGIFGNISDTLGSIMTAFRSLVTRQFDSEENKIKAILFGGIVFMKDSVVAISGSVGSVFDSLRQGLAFLVQYGLTDDHEGRNAMIDKDLFENDIEQVSRPSNSHFALPLTSIDTQNRIWLKILSREKQNYDVKKRLLRKHQEREPIQRGGFSRANEVQRQSQLYWFASMTSKVVTFIPRKLAQTSAGVLNIFLDEEVQRMVHKVRPPRFVSFTMELEPYSKKKAFALEILNEINLNVIEAETIQKLYTMSQTVIIVTGKRVICVEEQSSKKHLIAGLPLPQAQSQNDHQFESSGGTVYKHWNVFFKDIFRVSIDILDKDNRISPQDYERVLFAADGTEPQYKNMLQIILKLHYMVSDDTKSAQKPSGMGAGRGLLDEAGQGLRMGRRDIRAKVKDYRTVRRLFRMLQYRVKC